MTQLLAWPILLDFRFLIRRVVADRWIANSKKQNKNREKKEVTVLKLTGGGATISLEEEKRLSHKLKTVSELSCLIQRGCPFFSCVLFYFCRVKSISYPFLLPFNFSICLSYLWWKKEVLTLWRNNNVLQLQSEKKNRKNRHDIGHWHARGCRTGSSSVERTVSAI